MRYALHNTPPCARHVVYARVGAGNSRSRCAFASRILRSTDIGSTAIKCHLVSKTKKPTFQIHHIALSANVLFRLTLPRSTATGLWPLCRKKQTIRQSKWPDFWVAAFHLWVLESVRIRPNPSDSLPNPSESGIHLDDHFHPESKIAQNRPNSSKIAQNRPKSSKRTNMRGSPVPGPAAIDLIHWVLREQI